MSKVYIIIYNHIIIRVLRPDMTFFGCGLANKHYPSLSSRQEPQNNSLESR